MLLVRCHGVLDGCDLGTERREIAVAVSDGELTKPPRPVAWRFGDLDTMRLIENEELIDARAKRAGWVSSMPGTCHDAAMIATM
jgi:hypothetical protein